MIYVLAYPKFNAEQERSISAFRQAHEPERAELVAPHVTFVFGLKNCAPHDIASHCKLVAAQTTPVDIQFSGHEISYDPFEGTHKILLMTSVGTDRIITLHEQLYAGPHHVERHPDTDYKPHMTVATNADRSVLERVDLTAIGSFPIKATISSLDVVRLTDGRLVSIESLSFSG